LPGLDVVRVQDVGLSGHPLDPLVRLAHRRGWCATLTERPEWFNRPAMSRHDRLGRPKLIHVRFRIPEVLCDAFNLGPSGRTHRRPTGYPRGLSGNAHR
jgi:hypothetical protein